MRLPRDTVLAQADAGRTNKVKLCANPRVTGVAFFDFKHGQTVVAPNGIALHPLVAFHCLSD